MKLTMGLMSGTSCDGISAALVGFQGRTFRLLAYQTVPYPKPLAELLRRAHELSVRGAAQVNLLLGELLASAALRLLRRSRVPAQTVFVIGSHGHTVYHGPTDAIPCTLQLGEPAIIAERTGRPVVANFRMRDVAAGGQGAPLVPFFDQFFFGQGPVRAMQNIGGIANVTVVGRRVKPIAFDTGPGNCLIDVVARRISRGRLACDRHGRLAARGCVNHAAITRLMRHPYFRTAPPKSTGREVFHEQLLGEALGRNWWTRPYDALATVTYLTALSIAEGYRRFVPHAIHEVIVSGGGVRNRTLMGDLANVLHPIPVRSIERYGLPPQAKEPVAFAFLALRAIKGQVNHLPQTTGAIEARVLGTITP